MELRMPWTRSAPAPEPGPDIEDRNYTDAITDAIVAAAADATASGYVAALEVAAGQLARAFAAARVGGPGAAAFTPDVMAHIGRRLVETGEAVWLRVGRRLRPAESYSISSADLDTYDLALAGGDARAVRASRVLHVRWNLDVSSGRGVAPLSTARTLRMLVNRLEGSMRDEAQAAVGYLLPVPADGAAGVVEQLRRDIADLAGRIAVVETTRGGWGDGAAGAPRRDYELARLGPAYPDGNVRLYQASHNVVLAACGYPVQLATDSDGTAQREAWRRYLHGTVAPLGRLVTTAAALAGLSITLDWDELFASDISGRARASQSLVNGGMSVEAAAAASGLLEPQETANG